MVIFWIGHSLSTSFRLKWNPSFCCFVCQLVLYFPLHSSPYTLLCWVILPPFSLIPPPPLQMVSLNSYFKMEQTRHWKNTTIICFMNGLGIQILYLYKDKTRAIFDGWVLIWKIYEMFSHHYIYFLYCLPRYGNTERVVSPSSPPLKGNISPYTP